jgi:hypothetical protein
MLAASGLGAPEVGAIPGLAAVCLRQVGYIADGRVFEKIPDANLTT